MLPNLNGDGRPSLAGLNVHTSRGSSKSYLPTPCESWYSLKTMSFHFTTVTYNVLAPSHVHPNLYPLADSENLSLLKRLDLLLARLRKLDADLYFLQEVEIDVLRQIKHCLGPGYSAVFKAHKDEPDGCAIFARKKKLLLRGIDYIELEAGRQAPVAWLEMVGAGRVLTAICAHLSWSSDGSMQALQMRQLLEHREQRTEPDTDDMLVWIVGGDLNSEPTSRTIHNAGRSGLVSSHGTLDFTSNFQKLKKLDYLLYSPTDLTCIPAFGPRIDSSTVLPGAREPSDHLPVQATFRLIS